ncbi:hypothetical protein JCM3770_006406 [Rhodotorula araucariae]
MRRSSPLHRPLAERPLARFAALLTVVGVAVIPTATAAVLPVATEPVRDGCRPVLSGLVQALKSTAEPDVFWMAVGGKGAAQDGVKAAKFDGRRSVPQGLQYEWFVEQTDVPGVYSISSSATISSCGELASSTANNPFMPAAQRPFPGDAAPTGVTSCSSAHLFRLDCTTCDTHEDSAHGCFVQSITKNQGREKRDEQRHRQLWDIVPS